MDKFIDLVLVLQWRMLDHHKMALMLFAVS